jgi:hypothetical protein
MTSINKKAETILTAWPEYCSGPGWANQIIWVIIQDSNQNFRLDSIQPDEQNAETQLLFNVCASAHRSLLTALNKQKQERE